MSGSQVLAAGMASTGAAFVTSKFGVAGTILGAALTTMIITGGAAILKAYLEGVTGNVRKVPRKLRSRRERRKAARYAEPPETLSERPDLRNNFMGRLRAAVGWFSSLPLPARRSILVKGLIAAAIAFVISMGAIYALERGIGNSLSCGLWGTCPEGATPGIHLGGGVTGASSSIGGGHVSQTGGDDRDGVLFRSDQQSNPLRPQDPGSQPDRDSRPPAQQQNPAVPSNPRPLEPAQQQNPAVPSNPTPLEPAQQPPAGEPEVPVPGAAPSGAEPQPTE
ncbi:MAG TPA: hypothetical protein VK869_13535 [Rubrobacteraceae bacterium]|nr:hypothetical protein [Rubrobacteraceae bacterium]